MESAALSTRNLKQVLCSRHENREKNWRAQKNREHKIHLDEIEERIRTSCWSMSNGDCKCKVCIQPSSFQIGQVYSVNCQFEIRTASIAQLFLNLLISLIPGCREPLRLHFSVAVSSTDDVQKPVPNRTDSSPKSLTESVVYRAIHSDSRSIEEMFRF